jgi:hypothetical protein
VILGAGASKDAWSKGGPPRQNSWTPPPLANELFQFDTRDLFWQVAKDYRGVRVLAPHLAERCNASLEEKLLELSQHPLRTALHPPPKTGLRHQRTQQAMSLDGRKWQSYGTAANRQN